MVSEWLTSPDKANTDARCADADNLRGGYRRPGGKPEIEFARGLPWATRQPERTGALAIVGSGPSVGRRLEPLRHWSGEIWAINGAYDYLLGHGIVPHGFFCVDPLPGLAEYVANAQRETTFYVAATCHPAVLDALAGFNVVLWFPEQESRIYPEGATEITGGTSAFARAPFMAHALGWRDMTIFGADSSFESTGQYCYQAGTFAEDSQSAIPGDRSQW